MKWMLMLLMGCGGTQELDYLVLRRPVLESDKKQEGDLRASVVVSKDIPSGWVTFECRCICDYEGTQPVEDEKALAHLSELCSVDVASFRGSTAVWQSRENGNYQVNLMCPVSSDRYKVDAVCVIGYD
jgi:hypothetical protein